MSAIEFRSVDKIYRGRRVINSLSFMIEGGERIVLFGPSGCVVLPRYMATPGWRKPGTLAQTTISDSSRRHPMLPKKPRRYWLSDQGLSS